MQRQTHFTIGSAEDADIRLCEPTVSQHHCELQWKGDAWVISDCDSTNGTFINGRKISQPACLGPDDRVTLGRGVKLDIPAPPQAPKVSHMSEASQRSPLLSQPTQHRPRVAMLVMLGGMGVLSLLCGVVLIGFWLTPRPSLSDAAKSNTLNTAESTASATTTPHRIADTPSEVSAQTPTTEKLGPVWALIAESADQSQRLLLGTAVAIEHHRLIALASVVDAAHGVKEQYPRVAIMTPSLPGKLVYVQSHGLHPDYQAALAELAKFRQELQAKLNTVADLDEPALDESLAWSQRLDEIMVALNSHDIAYITVDSTLETIATTTDVPSNRDDLECRLQGYPTLDTVPLISNDLEKYQLDIPGRWLTEKRDDDTGSPHAAIQYTSFSSFVKPISFACFDSHALLIGLCGASESTDRDGEHDQLPAVPFAKFWQTK